MEAIGIPQLFGRRRQPDHAQALKRGFPINSEKERSAYRGAYSAAADKSFLYKKK